MVVHMQAEQHNPIMDRERETVLINIFAEDKIIDAKTYNKDCLNVLCIVKLTHLMVRVTIEFSNPDK